MSLTSSLRQPHVLKAARATGKKCCMSWLLWLSVSVTVFLSLFSARGVVAQGFTVDPNRLDFGVTASNSAGQLHWVVHAYEPCPCVSTSACDARQPCELGSMGRLVLCQEISSGVADSVCLSDPELATKMPTAVSECVDSVCNHDYKFVVVNDWVPCPCDVLSGTCSTQCEAGSKARRVVCQDPLDIVLDAHCVAAGYVRPDDVAVCYGAAACGTYDWVAASWSSCPETTFPDFGRRTREVVCRATHTVADVCSATVGTTGCSTTLPDAAVVDDWCIATDKPVSSEYCVPASQFAPKWVIITEWNTCPCPEADGCTSACVTGSSMRRVICQDPINIIDDAFCEAVEAKPAWWATHLWIPYAHVTTLPVTSSHYVNGFSSQWLPDVIRPCASFEVTPDQIVGGPVTFRVTMGVYVDYYKTSRTLCDALSAGGKWYWHSYTGPDGPWTSTHGNHGALLLGFTPYRREDTRVWTTFVGAPDGPQGYHAEGGGCCHASTTDTGAQIQFWREFTIDVYKRGYSTSGN